MWISKGSRKLRERRRVDGVHNGGEGVLLL
jgi:hypothetical protein